MPVHSHLTDEVAESTALYALGIMSDKERTSMEEHLAQGCAVCQSEISRYGDVLARWTETHAVTPPSTLRDRLLESIRKESPPPSRPLSPVIFEEAGLIVLRTSQMEWTSPSPPEAR